MKYNKDMIYNILLIDENETARNTKGFLEDIENKNIIIASDNSTLHAVLKADDIHIIIINTDVVSLKSLSSILNDIDVDSTHIPIIIIGKYDKEEVASSELLIFDYIDTGFNQEIIYNKIKFCQKMYEKELEHASNIQKLLYIDNLTGLPNRVKLIKDVQDDELGIDALAVIDLNAFKEVNDFYGHRIGDNILKAVVEIIHKVVNEKSNKPDGVTLYKFSADVYCLANHGLEHWEFEDLVTIILGAIESKIVKLDSHEIDISARAGLTFSPKNNKLITADIALQAAKKQNKDYIVFYEELDNLREYQNNMLWTKKLKRALELDNIIVYFQPLINNQTMNVDKYECLVRMYDDEEDKVVSPFFFLDVSKKANQYTNLTKIVIQKSFKEFADKDFEFSLNVSYEDIDDKYFLPFVELMLKRYKGIASRVVWEILEDEGVQSYEVLLNFINEVKKLGCKVAIDDFGSGYSNFEHLLKMNVDYLKIDASLVKNIVDDENSYKVVKTVVDFADSLELKTIAEFVENEKIFELTKELGVTFSQGYHFSAPIPKPELVTFKK